MYKPLRLLLAYFSLFCTTVCWPANAPNTAPTPQGLSERAVIVEEGKLDVERGKLKFEREKFEKESKQKQDDAAREFWKTVIAGLAVPVPITLAIGGFWFEAWKRRQEGIEQRQSREANERLQFRLKAAEIALDVRNSAEIQPKALALAQLFPESLHQDFARNLDPEAIRFGPPSTEAKLELLKLLAQYPTQRVLILRIWGHMFPADTGRWKRSEHPNYAWFNGLTSDSSINVNAKVGADPP